MGDYVRALTDGVMGDEQLVGKLTDATVDRVVVKMTTSQTQQWSQPQGMKRVRSPGLSTTYPVYDS